MPRSRLAGRSPTHERHIHLGRRCQSRGPLRRIVGWVNRYDQQKLTRKSMPEPDWMAGTSFRFICMAEKHIAANVTAPVGAAGLFAEVLNHSDARAIGSLRVLPIFGSNHRSSWRSRLCGSNRRGARVADHGAKLRKQALNPKVTHPFASPLGLTLKVSTAFDTVGELIRRRAATSSRFSGTNSWTCAGECMVFRGSVGETQELGNRKVSNACSRFVNAALRRDLLWLRYG